MCIRDRFIDKNTGARVQPFGIFRKQYLCLVGRKASQLDQGINPHGIERWQIANQSPDPRLARAQVGWSAQIKAFQQISKLR